MMTLLHPETRYAVHLRCRNNDKVNDWIGSLTTTNKIHTYWGRSESLNRHSSRDGSLKDLDRLIAQKLVNGYREVDRYHLETGWLSINSVEKISSPMLQLGPKVVLTVSCPAALVWDF